MRVLLDCWYAVGWRRELPAQADLERVVADIAVSIVLDGDKVEARARGKVAPALVKHKLIWVWLGAPERANAAEIPDLSHFDTAPDSASFYGDMTMQANYLLGVDNIMDLSHADTLHPHTLGGGAVTRAGGIVKRQGNGVHVIWEARADKAFPVFDRQLPTPGMPADTTMEVLWHPSSVISLRTRVAPAGQRFEDWFDIRAVHIMTPVSDKVTHYQYGATRNYALDNVELSAFTSRAVRAAFEDEDKPVLEAVQANMGTSDLWSLHPVLLSVDAGPVQVRRTLDRMIEAQASA